MSLCKLNYSLLRNLAIGPLAPNYRGTLLLTSLNPLITDLLRRTMSSVQNIKTIDYDGVKALKENTDVLLIDVREKSELLETGVIPGSINIPLGTVENVLKCSTPEEFEHTYKRTMPSLQFPLVFSCKSGKRSFQAAQTAVKLGFKDVTNYSGGWLDWEEKLKCNG